MKKNLFMIRSILASIAMYSIVFYSLGQAAIALPQANLADKKPAQAANCSSCSLSSGNPLDRLATLGYQSQNNPLLPIKHSLFKGFPIGFVSSATGELSFAMTDIAFKDNPLLLFQRAYDSSRVEDSGLGRGWSFAFNDSITLNDDNAILTTSTGDKFAYRRADAKNYVLQTPEAADVPAFEKENGNTISAKNGDITKTYKRAGNIYYLSEINAPAGWEVSIKRNSNGKIINISSISGEINLNWSNGNNAKLLSVTDSASRRISFEQSNGQLQSQTTATGGEWRYEYTNGRLSRAVDPANRIALRAKYDAAGRAVESGDAVGTNRIAYELNAGNVSTVTTVTDSLNYTRTFRQNKLGMPTTVTDKEGTLLNLLYNEANRAVQMTDANGATTFFNFDAEQRLTRQLSPNGDEKTFEYNKNGKLAATTDNGERTEIVYDEANLTESRTRRNGKNVKSIFNRRGQEIHSKVENGLGLDSEYDEKGRETAYIYSDIGRFEKGFDAAGRKVSEKLPSGLTYNYEYDANNKVTRKSDNRGNGFRTEYDASGALTKFVKKNGAWSQIIRDEAGRIVEMRNSHGKSRRYAYDERGALTEYFGADGRQFQFQYDSRGTLQNVIKAQNANLIRRRDQPDNIFGIKKANKNSLLQIKNIGYKTSFAGSKVNLSSAGSTEEFCMFGDDDFSFTDFGTDLVFGIDLQSDPFSSCNDPFAGMWGFEGGGSSGQPETCEQCRQRNKTACDDDANSNLRRVFAVGAAIILGCVWTGPGELVCGLVSILLGIVGGGEVAYAHRACYGRVDNSCPICTQ